MLTEKEKMQTGEYYSSTNAELIADRAKAQDLLLEYNQLRVMQTAEKQEILGKLLSSMGNDCRIEMFFYCSYGYNTHIGDGFFANVGCTILDSAAVNIGNNVLLGPNVSIFTATRPINPKERLAGYEYAKPVTIGNNVWIGGNSVILPGVTISDNSVIAAGSVVSSSIQACAVAAGNPAKVRKRNI